MHYWKVEKEKEGIYPPLDFRIVSWDYTSICPSWEDMSMHNTLNMLASYQPRVIHLYPCIIATQGHMLASIYWQGGSECAAVLYPPFQGWKAMHGAGPQNFPCRSAWHKSRTVNSKYYTVVSKGNHVSIQILEMR